MEEEDVTSLCLSLSSVRGSLDTYIVTEKEVQL